MLVLKQKRYAFIGIITSLLCINVAQAKIVNLQCYRYTLIEHKETAAKSQERSENQIFRIEDQILLISYDTEGNKLGDSEQRIQSKFLDLPGDPQGVSKLPDVITSISFSKGNKRINYFGALKTPHFWALSQKSAYIWNLITQSEKSTDIDLYCNGLKKEDFLTVVGHANLSTTYQTLLEISHVQDNEFPGIADVNIVEDHFKKPQKPPEPLEIEEGKR